MLKGYTHISLLIDSSGSMSIIKQATIDNYNKFLAEQKKLPGKATLSHFEFSSGSKLQTRYARPTRHLVDYLPCKWDPSQQLYNADKPKTDPNVIPVTYSANNNALPLMFGPQANVNNMWIPPGWPNVGGSITTHTGISPTTAEFSIVEDFVDIKNARELNPELFVPHNFTPLLDSIGRAIFETGERLAKLPAAERPDRILFVIITDGQENASQEYSKEDVKTVIEHQQGKYNWDFIFLGANMDAISVGTSYGIGAGMSVNFTATAASVGGSSGVLNEKVALYRSSVDVSAAKSFLNYSNADRTASLGGDPGYTAPVVPATQNDTGADSK